MEVDNIEDKEANDYVLCTNCQDTTFEESGVCVECQRDKLRETLRTLAEAAQEITKGEPDRRDYEHLEMETVRAFDLLEK